MARRAGPSLDRTAVSAAAAELADREGLGGVTLATVAARLGVRTPSLYNHVAGLPGLRRELALLGLRELGQRMGRAVVGKADDRALEAIAHAYRAYAHEHPGVYAAAQQVPAAGDAAWEAAGAEVVGIVRAVLAGYGLEGDDALPYHAGATRPATRFRVARNRRGLRLAAGPRRKLPPAAPGVHGRSACQIVIFSLAAAGLAAAGLAVAGRSPLAWILGAAVVVNGALAYAWGQ